MRNELSDMPAGTFASPYKGLKKREVFAVAAMQGILASWPPEIDLSTDAAIDFAARTAVAHADALSEKLMEK